MAGMRPLAMEVESESRDVEWGLSSSVPSWNEEWMHEKGNRCLGGGGSELEHGAMTRKLCIFKWNRLGFRKNSHCILFSSLAIEQ
jgi:hypothetical protein